MKDISAETHKALYDTDWQQVYPTDGLIGAMSQELFTIFVIEIGNQIKP